MTPAQEAWIRAVSAFPHGNRCALDKADLAALLAEVDRLRGVISKAHRISIRHDHEITRLVDLQDHLEAALSTEPKGESNG